MHLFFVGPQATSVAMQLKEQFWIEGEITVTDPAQAHTVMQTFRAATSVGLVCAGLEADRAAAFIAQVHARFSGAPVLVVATRPSGVHHLVAQERVLVLAASELERERAQVAAHFGVRVRSRTRLLACLNTKGGVGKTTVLVNLAAMLAARDRRVLVIDADVNDGNVALVTNTPTDDTSLSALVRRSGRGVTADDVQANVACWHGVDLLCATSGLDREARQLMSLPVAQQILQAAEGRYDLVCVDLPADNRFSSPFGSALLQRPDPEAILYLVVVAPGLFEEEGAARALELLRRFKRLRHTALVLNRDLTDEALPAALRRPDPARPPLTIAARLPDAPDLIVASHRRHVPVAALETARPRRRGFLGGTAGCESDFVAELEQLATFVEGHFGLQSGPTAWPSNGHFATNGVKAH